MKQLASFIVVITLAAASGAGESEIDFDTEIVPLLSKAGCNAAACHGGATGQAGFRLSLFGGDPESDHRAIVHDMTGRRVNLADANQSLVLLKPTGQLDHGGGDVLEQDSVAALTIAAWIRSGSKRLQLRQLEGLRITPSEHIANSLPADVQLSVWACFSDGTQRDVTDIAGYRTQDESALQVDTRGKLSVARPGQHTALVRFGNQVEIITVTAPIGSSEFTNASFARRNWIDDEINATLQTLRLGPAAEVDDATFLRRVTLDLTGRLPAPEDVAQFAADTDPSKRTQTIVRLLESDHFTEYWAHWLATQLRIRTPATDEAAAVAFYEWITRQVAGDVGWDQMATSLILAEGDTHHVGPATVHRFFATARDEAEYVSEVVMGVRLRCANCHNHPLDRWTQDDYHGLAAVFAGWQRGQVVRFTNRGDVTHPRTGTNAAPRIPGERFLADRAEAREELVAWLTNKENRYFAPAMVGRVWQALMGRGLTTPVDDLRDTNPATHPRLLTKLSEFFVAHQYKLRPLIQLICDSAAYARCSHPLPDSPRDDEFYSHAISKPLSAEVLADAISDVTGVGDNYGTASVTRAIRVVDRTKSAAALQFLGQCLPSEGCSTGTGGGRGIAAKLHLMNGPLLNQRIASDDGRLAKLLAAQVSSADIVREFYLRALSRPPTTTELKSWSDRLDCPNEAERSDRCADFLWALLNCHEFTTNH